MIVDGRKLAENIKSELQDVLRTYSHRPTLALFIGGENFVVEKFVALKKQFAQELGVRVEEYRFGPLDKTAGMIQKIFYAAREHDGIIIQLPLPHQYEIEPIRRMLPITHDVDVFGDTAFEQFKEGRLPILPPVPGAIAEILARTGFAIAGRRVVVVGEGKLVGQPAAVWANRMGAQVVIVTEASADREEHIRNAEVLILGAGSPGLITPDLIQEGVMIFDAGTSEEGGKLKGDVDPACAAKARLFTPTPGGIGPLTVAMIFKNLLKLYDSRHGIQRY